MMSDFDMEIIEHRISPKIYERGELYYEEGRVKNLRILSSILMADVAGTEEYKVRIENVDGDLISQCNCPFEDEEFCKHAVAVLLAWQHRNEDEKDATAPFSDKECQVHLKKLLSKKSKEELADFILENISEERTELILAEGALPDSKNSAVFSRSIRARINGLFRRGQFIDYQSSFKLSSEVSNITVAIEKASQKDPLLGLELFWHLLKKAKNIFNDIDDSSGAFGSEIHFTSELITDYLGRIKESQRKGQILREIFQEWQKDEYGYFDCLREVLIEAPLSKSEIAHLLPEVELRIKETQDIIDLTADEIDRRHHTFSLSELIFLYTKLKIKSGDIEDGLSSFRRYLPVTKDYDAFGGILIELRRLSEAEAVLLDGLEKYPGRKERIYDGLIYIYEQTKDKEKLRGVLLEYFYYMPSETLYKKLKKLNLDDWAKLQKELLFFLDKPTYYHILIQICLLEGKLLEAFNVAKRYDAGPDTLVQLGKILAQDYPDEAIWCYKRAAEYKIERGSRYYWAAVNYIDKVRKIYSRQGRNNEFEDYLFTIKETHKRKKALIEKLSRFSLRER